MNYEIVNLEEKIIAGKCIVTSNSDPKMGEKIGKLWGEYYDQQDGYYWKINNKMNKNVIGLYSDYVGDNYTVTAGAEVTKADKDMETKIIPAGKYAKFAIHGNMITAVVKAWSEIWATPLERTFTGDFEEYLPCDYCDHEGVGCTDNCDNCYINIYVAIK